MSRHTVAVCSSVGRAFHVAGPHTLNARRPRTVLVRWLSRVPLTERSCRLPTHHLNHTMLQNRFLSGLQVRILHLSFISRDDKISETSEIISQVHHRTVCEHCIICTDCGTEYRHLWRHNNVVAYITLTSRHLSRHVRPCHRYSITHAGNCRACRRP